MVFLLISGCSSEQSIEPILSTLTATITQKPMFSSTPEPSQTLTLMPSLTETPTTTTTQTDTPTSKPLETSTPYPTRTPWDRILISEDKQYIAKLFWHYESTNRQTIEISDLNGNILWLVPFQGELPIGLPAKEPIHI